MPHIIVEYSANLDGRIDVKALVDDLHAAAAASGLFEIPAIRTRAVRRDVFRVADGDTRNGFVHVTARVRQGRTAEQRKALGQALLAAANRRLDGVFASQPLALTIEVHEIDPEMTFRRNSIRERATTAA
jgi:5-carboxymethyl-2-hydroxymuconate isomerase